MSGSSLPLGLSSLTPPALLLLPKWPNVTDIPRCPWECGAPREARTVADIRASQPSLVAGLWGLQWGKAGSGDTVDARRGVCLTAPSLRILMAP